MKKFLYLLAFITIGVSSCSKDGDGDISNPACENQNFGTITVSNSSSNPYDFYIDNVFIERIGGGSITQKIQINEGNGRQVRATQVSGYILYPTVANSSFNVVRCTDYSWQVP